MKASSTIQKTTFKAAIYAALLAASWPALAVEIDYEKLASHDDSVTLDALQIEHFLSSPGDGEKHYRSIESGPDIEVTYLGKGESTATMATPEATQSRASHQPQTRARRSKVADFQQEAGFVYMDLYNPDTRNEFRLKIPADKMQDLVAQEGLTVGENGSRSRLDQSKALSNNASATPDYRALSNGVDSRVILGKAGVAQTSAAGKKMVDIGNCSGALIGPKHVLTAAHCIWSLKEEKWYEPVLRVGRSGEAWLHERNMKTNNSRWFWTPSCYRTTGSRACDIGMLVADATTSATGIGEENGVGWFGWYWTADDDKFINTWSRSFKNAGYPLCNSDADAPKNCVANALYSDTGNCRVGSVTSPGPDGIDRIFYHSCDASAGHSGSPIYMTTSSGSLVIVGVHTHSKCRDCGSTDAYPAGATRITKEYSDVIALLRERFQ